MPATERPDPAYRRVVALTIALFLSYLTVAMSLSAVTIHVVQGLGFANTYGGLAVGIAFLSTILTRGWAGALADRIGGKPCMQRGLVIYAAAGLVCLLASWSGLPAISSDEVLIVGRIWRPGAAVGLQGVGFAALGAFFSLYFLSHGWPHAGLGLIFFGVGFVLVRLFFGHMPDRFGGLPVAVVSLAVEAVGQYLLWLAPSPYAALAGALLTGLGCSMVFPAMGSEVVKQVPAHLRGTAVGGFAAFQDLAYGATGPIVGLLADSRGYASVFLIGGLSASLGLVLVLSMRRNSPGQG